MKEKKIQMDEIAATIAQHAVDVGYAQATFENAVSMVGTMVALGCLSTALAAVVVSMIYSAVRALSKGAKDEAASWALYCIVPAFFAVTCFALTVFSVSETTDDITAFAQDPYAATIEDVEAAIGNFYEAGEEG